jgi:hypothetical protein
METLRFFSFKLERWTSPPPDSAPYLRVTLDDYSASRLNEGVPVLFVVVLGFLPEIDRKTFPVQLLDPTSFCIAVAIPESTDLSGIEVMGRWQYEQNEGVCDNHQDVSASPSTGREYVPSPGVGGTPVKPAI